MGSDGNISFINNNYITSSVNNLDNYYLKTETYTREEINNQINTIRTGLFKPVDVLPDVGEEGYIYLVSNSNSQGDISTQAEVDNTRDEYIWIAADNKYEYIGSTSVDLTNYATLDDLDNYLLLTGGTLSGNLKVGSKVSITTAGEIQGAILKTTEVSDLNNTPSKYAVIDNDGTIKSRTLEETKEDLNLVEKTSTNLDETDLSSSTIINKNGNIFIFSGDTSPEEISDPDNISDN